MVLGELLKALYLNPWAAGRKKQYSWHGLLKLKSSQPVTLFLQQGHTDSSKATPPNPC